MRLTPSPEIAATSGTEGPGFTDMICGIATANAARSPVLVLASNKTIFAEDTERGIQDAYQQPTTEGLRKYGKRLITPARIHEYAGYAFRQLRSGVPKPVHLDFPAEIANARFRDASEIEYFYDKTKYRTDTKPHPDPRAIDQAVALLRDAERPMIVSSNGVFHTRAWDALRQVAERAQIPVVESGATKGQFPADHALSASTAPGALASADLVLLVGQYCMPTQGEFAFGPDTKYIRIDPEAGDIGRNLPIDLGIVSDEKAALEALAAALPQMRHDAWVAEIAAARAEFEAENEQYYQTGLGYTDAVHPSVIGKELADFLHAGSLPRDRTTIVQGGYGIARYTRRYLRSYRPGQIMNGAYQYGAIGPDVGYTIGVAAAVQHGVGPQADYKGHPIIAITGDAGFGYSGMEMETLSKYRLPAVVIVYNNNAWGTWEGQRNNQVGLPVHLFQENLRYDKLGEALGAHGEYVTAPGDFRPALERAYQVALDESRPSVVNVQAKKEFWLRDQYAPGFLGKIEPGVLSYYH
ncbi:MAG TPA: thiamine pyrophosphate-binding protein [Acidobacteria bacterium]|nr:thiamine pyrophosphate-binding protein [Acidobacteriota bacterium]